LGPRGDDKARRIRMNKQGNITIEATAFDFSLAPINKNLDKMFEFEFNETDQKWILKKAKHI
ncbi:MAG: hypothetical protein ACOVOV_05505, partial [Dolichospermum sp.]